MEHNDVSLEQDDPRWMNSIDIDGDDIRCDESKCVSKGQSYLFDKSNTCYGDGFVFPKMCADGYLPVDVEDEPVTLHVDPLWGFQVPVSYFTCCPPPIDSSYKNVTRHCSDPIPTVQEDDNTISVCDDHNPKVYSRRMKTSMGVVLPPGGVFGISPRKTDSVVCCDAPIPYEDDDFLAESECVPYRSKLYELKRATNLYGLLRAITCDFPDGSFSVPRPLDGQDETHVASTGLYQCCKTGTALKPFIKDNAFKTTVYTSLVLWSVAAATSAVVVVALLVPLFLKLFKHQKKERSRRSVFTSMESFASRKKPPTSTSMKSPSSRNKPLIYSNYNLYVVYLALFDLIYATIQIGFYVSMIAQKYNLDFHHILASQTSIIYVISIFRAQDGTILYAMININMWINAIISYQILLLLRKSRFARKMSQPSLKRINIQVGSVLLLSLVYWVLLFTLRRASMRAGLAGDFARVERISATLEVLYWTFIYTPIAFLCGTSFLIRWRGYLPSVNNQSSTRDKALRQLSLFFFRIVLIFFFIWIPSIILMYFAVMKFTAWYFLYAQWLTAIQPILSTCMVLTKFDARKYIVDLITLSYFRSAKDKEKSKHTILPPNTDQNNTSKTHTGHGESLAMSAISVTFRDCGDCHSNADGKDYTKSNTEYDGDNYSDNDALYFSVLGFVATDADTGCVQDVVENAAEIAIEDAIEDTTDVYSNSVTSDDNDKYSIVGKRASIALIADPISDVYQ